MKINDELWNIADGVISDMLKQKPPVEIDKRMVGLNVDERHLVATIVLFKGMLIGLGEIIEPVLNGLRARVAWESKGDDEYIH